MKKGMTLIEVLVSSIILAISVVALMYSFVINDRIVIENSHKFEAERLLSDRFEKIINLKVKSDVLKMIKSYTTGTNGNFSGGFANAAPQKVQYVGVNPTSTTYSLEYDLTPVFIFGGSDIYKNPSIYKIIGKVTWMQNNQKKELKMTIFTNEN